MGFIENELEEVKKLVQQNIEGCKLVSCVKTMVRAEIKRTTFKTVIVCMQFPENYPQTPILIELKSKTLSEKLLQRLTDVCESEAKKFLGKPQVMSILMFLQNFLIENPLSCCYNEINHIKKLLIDGHDELKLKQKTSSVVANFVHSKYFWNVKIYIPDNYPEAAIELKSVKTNFPPAFHRHILEQGKEIARQCVEAPLRKPKPNEPPFKPKPSLEKCVTFFANCVKLLPSQQCQFCKEQCLPSDPQEDSYPGYLTHYMFCKKVKEDKGDLLNTFLNKESKIDFLLGMGTDSDEPVMEQKMKKMTMMNYYMFQISFYLPRLIEINEESSRHIERIYCGHLFHQECILNYMKTPPFGNKRCIVCGVKIFHHKWCLSDKLAETRWSHEQARERELAEVEDFFK